MTQDILRYDLMVQEALKGVVRKILSEAGRDGLPGDHHFYVTFRTTAPGVRLSQRLREKHPDEMTIVLQHQFWDLNVGEHSFEVGLSFSGVPERVLVPFDAVTTFFDPSVQFGLKFEVQAAETDTPGRETEIGSDRSVKPSRGPEPVLAASAPVALPARTPALAIKPAAPSKPVSLPKPASLAKGAPPVKAGSGKPPADKPVDADASDDAGAKVLSLDSFRKKT